MVLGLKLAVIISLICHILMFSSVEPTFGKKIIKKNPDFTKIFFLGPILQKSDYSLESAQDVDHMRRLNTRISASMLKPGFLETYKLNSIIFRKPPAVVLGDNKTMYLQTTPKVITKKADSSIIFSPPMPYDFLLYFRERQTAHVEVSFYISPKGKIVGLKRKISSGNPEVDLLIMRNLVHFLNLCKSSFALSSWQTVNVELSP